MDEFHIYVQEETKAALMSGSPLIPKDGLMPGQTLPDEGTVVHVRSADDELIGTGYIGEQTKGVGWLVSRRADTVMDASFFAEKIQQAWHHRRSLHQSQETTAYRIFNGEGDGVGGLAIDYYHGYALIHWYSAGIFAFQTEVLQALAALPGVQGVYEKKRFETGAIVEEEEDFVQGERAPEPLIVHENGINYAVDLDDGPMTGIFLDQRHVRRKIRDEYARGRTVLNTFSYTGAFSVSAALGGAVHTTSVDLANRSYAKTVEQFSINGLDYEAHDIVVQDVFQYFKRAKKQDKAFDLVVVDPPSFARSKKKTFSVKKDYQALLEEVIAVTANDGIVVASTNANVVAMKKFRSFVDRACQSMKLDYQILETHRLPEDFPTVKTKAYDSDYLKVIIFKVSRK
ncbi:SAM-dependent methyltransferase [Salsuginibacillus halophilus]|uniref:SAM-dependent methyltransferase n=2 Tax=Salsuginibacillus halophilus TaxID=517424 RepID=A0A2P8HLH1_9BACI|nr:class I SAM-dependent rRNA methyltransferase [Salsuginibacillus halophilus]PSL47064.1 SAM-dependent methyltransferase [Salsuginibacillus halophilus]